MKIAVDAMGGDYAPEAIVEGAVQAAEEYGFPLILVGQEDRVHKELSKYKINHLAIEVKHASQVVDMQDLPSVALRRKKDSSLHVAINMIRHGEADAAVSAGNTGAAMAIGKLACRVLEGIDRPALATVLPNIDGVTVMIDVGANVDCKPIHLLQFAVMGHAYAKEVYGIETPRIGLLSIGEEASKGNVLTKEVFEPLSNSSLNFIGNAEGRDVFNGRVDVVVCDGFIGNVVLKVSESLAKTMSSLLRQGFTRNWRTKLGYLLVRPEMDAMKRRVDYSEYGGAPLLGLNGVVIVSHGSSKARAMKNAIRVAAESVNHRINDHIIKILTECEFDTKSRAKVTSFWRQFKESIRHDSDKGKSGSDKQKEPDQLSIQEETPPEQDLKAKNHESSKKLWWHLKETKQRENDHIEGVSEEQEQVEEPVEVKEPAESIEITQHGKEDKLSESGEQGKRAWWKITEFTHHPETTKIEVQSQKEPKTEEKDQGKPPEQEVAAQIEQETKHSPVDTTDTGTKKSENNRKKKKRKKK